MKRSAWIAVLFCLMGLTAILIWTSQAEPSAEHTQEELRLSSILSQIEGAGACEVFVYESASAFTGESRQGLMILCEGARDLSTTLRIQQLAHTLTGIPIESIDICATQ